MTIVEVEAKISVLESTRDDVATKANAQMGPLQNQLNQIALQATEQLARIDGQLLVLKELREEFKPAKTEEPAPVESTPEPVSDSAA